MGIDNSISDFRRGFNTIVRKRKGNKKTSQAKLAMFGGGGWIRTTEANATDLQSAPFGHSGTPPYSIGAGGRIRTPDLLITNQLLYRLSYTSKSVRLSNSKD